jgi:hypothetical protein
VSSHQVPTHSKADPSTELINIHTAFHAGAYQQVLDFDTSSFSPSNTLPVRVLQLRSKIALGQTKEVITELSSESTPDLVAVRLLAEYEEGKDVLEQINGLVEQHSQENLTVQLVAGIVYERVGETEKALDVLSKHQGSLDAYVTRPSYSGEGIADPRVIALPSSYKFTFARTAPISLQRKHSGHGNGRRIAC